MDRHKAAGAGTAISVLGRNLAVLEALSSGFRLSLKEISEATGMAKPTAHRVLAALASEGLVAKDGTFGEYRLTTKLLRLTARTDDRVLLLDAVAPPARAMTAACQWPVALGLLERSQIIVYFSTRDMTTQTFRPSTLYESLELTTALGQAALSTLPLNQVTRELDGSPEFPRGSAARADLERKLGETRARGYAVRPSGRGGTASVAIGLKLGSPRVGALVATVFETTATPELFRQLATDLRNVHDVAAQNYRAPLYFGR